MALYHKDSNISTLSNLDLFSLPNTQAAVTKSQIVNFYPVSEISDESPIEFNVSGSGLEYISLKDTRLHIKCKILHADNTPIAALTKIGPVNLTLQSLWSQVDIFLNQRLVSSASNNYPYKAYIQTLLNFGSDAKLSQLGTQLYYKDTAKHLDDADPIAGNNSSLLIRAEYFSNSNIVGLIGPIHADVFQTPKLLLNNVDLRIKLYKSKNEFCLMSSETTPAFKIVITEAVLKINKVTVSPSITLAHAGALKLSTAKYPVSKIEVKSVSLAAGSNQVNLDDVWHGQIPSKVIIGFVSSMAFNGAYSKNPFNFQHYNLNYIACYVNGESVPAMPLKLTFSGTGINGANYMEAYQTLFSGTGVLNSDSGTDIDRDDYPGGYSLVTFTIDPLANNPEVWSMKQAGNLRIEARFNDPLSETVSMLIYGEFPYVVEVDEARNVILP